MKKITLENWEKKFEKNPSIGLAKKILRDYKEYLVLDWSAYLINPFSVEDKINYYESYIFKENKKDKFLNNPFWNCLCQIKSTLSLGLTEAK